MNYRAHRITVLGREINVRTTADEQTVKSVEAFVNGRLAQVQEAGKIGDTQVAAIVALMNIAEDYLALEKSCAVKEKTEADRISRLISRLDAEGC